MLTMSSKVQGRSLQYCNFSSSCHSVPYLLNSSWGSLISSYLLYIRSQCLAAEELAIEQLEDMLPAINKVSSKKKETSELDADLFVAQEGLDTLANLAIQGEDEGLPASSETRTKHPRHKPGCTCIVCIQPPSGKGSKHEQSCDCIICNTLKRRFRTMMERREKKQLEKVAVSASQNFQWQQSLEQVNDIDTHRGTDAGNSSPNQEDVSKTGCVDDHNEKNPSASPLKGQIDLNIQPEREEESSPVAEFGPMKH